MYIIIYIFLTIYHLPWCISMVLLWHIPMFCGNITNRVDDTPVVKVKSNSTPILFPYCLITMYVYIFRSRKKGGETKLKLNAIINNILISQDPTSKSQHRGSISLNAMGYIPFSAPQKRQRAPRHWPRSLRMRSQDFWRFGLMRRRCDIGRHHWGFFGKGRKDVRINMSGWWYSIELGGNYDIYLYWWERKRKIHWTRNLRETCVKECPVLGNPVDHGSFFPLEQEWGTDTRALDRPQLEKNMIGWINGQGTACPCNDCALEILVPSGKLSHNHGKSPFCSWVNPLFQWQCSIAMFDITRG